jgi:hypothetical protein
LSALQHFSLFFLAFFALFAVQFSSLCGGASLQNPESHLKTREPLAPGFASGFPKILLEKRSTMSDESKAVFVRPG